MIAMPVTEFARVARIPVRSASRRLLAANLTPDVQIVIGGRVIPMFSINSARKVFRAISPQVR